MNGKQYRQLRIPIWVIIALLFFSPPLALILLIVRSIKIPYPEGKTSDKSTDSSAPPGVKETADGAKKEQREQKDKKTISSKISAGEIVALVLAILFALASLGAITMFSSTPSVSQIISLAAYLGVSGASLAAHLVLKGRRKRSARYKEWIGDKDVFDLRDLSYLSGVPVRRVVRDLRRMTENNSFGPGAFIDETEMKFFRSAESSEKYKRDKKRFAGGPLGADEIEEYTAILMKIRQLNADIADPEVSDKIYKIEEQTRYIFGYVSDHPEKRGNISKFMNYYLPTTLKLLESYSTLEKMGEGGENMQKSKEGIEGILTMLSDGFVKQTDQLFASESIDISSEIEVLETMMKKDGLTENRDFGGAAAAATDMNDKTGGV